MASIFAPVLNVYRSNIIKISIHSEEHVAHKAYTFTHFPCMLQSGPISSQSSCSIVSMADVLHSKTYQDKLLQECTLSFPAAKRLCPLCSGGGLSKRNLDCLFWTTSEGGQWGIRRSLCWHTWAMMSGRGGSSCFTVYSPPGWKVHFPDVKSMHGKLKR